MLEPAPTGDPAPTPRCTWCSTPVTTEAATCPSCGATLIPQTSDLQVPGVTTLDAEAIVRARASVSRPGLGLGWVGDLTGRDSSSGPVPRESVAPPSEAVRREMQRLALQAEIADLEAETQALVVEAAIEASDAGLLDLDALAGGDAVGAAASDDAQAAADAERATPDEAQPPA